MKRKAVQMGRPDIEKYKRNYTKYIQDETRWILLNYIDHLESRLAEIEEVTKRWCPLLTTPDIDFRDWLKDMVKINTLAKGE
jgi:hypothetical protein